MSDFGEAVHTHRVVSFYIFLAIVIALIVALKVLEARDRKRGIVHPPFFEQMSRVGKLRREARAQQAKLRAEQRSGASKSRQRRTARRLS